MLTTILLKMDSSFLERQADLFESRPLEFVNDAQGVINATPALKVFMDLFQMLSDNEKGTVLGIKVALELLLRSTMARPKQRKWLLSALRGLDRNFCLAQIQLVIGMRSNLPIWAFSKKLIRLIENEAPYFGTVISILALKMEDPYLAIGVFGLLELLRRKERNDFGSMPTKMIQ